MHRHRPEHAPQSRRACLRDRAGASGVAFSLLVTLLGCSEERGSSLAEQPAPDKRPPTVQDESAWPVIEGPPLTMAASDTAVRAPLDATPSPDGESVYYLALSQSEAGDSVAGVFTVGKAGPEIETLALGAPLIAPVGISVSLDGKRLFVADSGVMSDAGVGAIMTLSSTGGEAEILEGTAGFLPRGVVVASVDDSEHVYFTGLDVHSGDHGVFRVGASGGAVETLASGAPFMDPAGVSVTPSGDVYVIDAFGGEGTAGVIRVRAGEAEQVASDLGVGFPAGIASTTDGSTVLISGLDPRSRRIVEARWLSDDNPATLHDLAAEFGVSAERIRQIEVKAMQKMRVNLAPLAAA